AAAAGRQEDAPPPAITSFRPSAPRNGIWRASIAAATRRRSAAICEAEPTPADAKVKVPGLAFAAATRSASVLKVREGDATTTVGWSPIKLTGAKARMASYGNVL